jgi:hypothetical protein
MPITYRVDLERKLVLVTAEGTLTDADLRAYIGSVLTNPDARPGFYELADLRGVTRVEVSIAAIDVVTGTIQEFGQQIKETKSAVVASSRNAEEISRLYELLRTRVRATVKLFQDVDEAQAWLGLINDNQQNPHRRVSPRKQVRLLACCRSGIETGSAQLVNISLTGALLESKWIYPVRGSLVKILFESPDIDAPIELTGMVVRYTQNSFAIQFLTVTNELLELVGDPS